MRYKRATDTKVQNIPRIKTFRGSYLILGMSLWIIVCHYGSHKDIRDVKDDLTKGKYDP